MVVTQTVAFEKWYKGLDKSDAALVYRVVQKLRERGLDLSMPDCKRLKTEAPLWELRASGGRSGIRVVFTVRSDGAVLLLGANKGAHAQAMQRLLAKAERLYKEPR